jgi:OOP family OmpA-OmpF porin
MPMNVCFRFFVAAAMLIFGASASAADIAGAKDAPGFKRFEGSEIVHFEKNNYAAYWLAKDSDYNNWPSIEGEVTRYVYLGPSGHSSLEVLRNYQDMLTEAGFQKTLELGPREVDSHYFHERYYWQSQFGKATSSPWSGTVNHYYSVYEGMVDGHKTTVAILVGEGGAGWQFEIGPKQTITAKPDQVVLGLDIIKAKAIANKMVVVQASDMAEALATKGSVDLYGIYFDTDKADIKPESAATIKEIASLLKIDRSLKLEVAGHTDNTGGAEHNMKLSQDRAASVVRELTTTHGVAVDRLQARGYGDTKPVAPNDTEDGRAKNRRVELKKIPGTP